MKPPSRSIAQSTCILFFFALLPPIGSSAQSAPGPAAPAPLPTSTIPDEAVVLSPFTITAGSEQGYLATQTLSGTRLKTDLSDIGSALTIFTEQMMDDLGANNINQILNFAPNTDTFVSDLIDVSGNGNDFINVATKYVTRGGSTSVVGQDFFNNNIPNDRFNSEAFTFTRGPNAILFGLGNAAGAFVSSTKRAKFKTATTVEYQLDHRGSFRGTLDHNQVIKKGLAAIRYAGVYEDTNGFRLPSGTFQRRHFLTTLLTPFKQTALRLNYETGLTQTPGIRPWPSYDSVTPWIDAGRPLLATYTNTAGGKPVGISNYTNVALVSTEFSAGGTRIPTQSLVNQGQSSRPTYATGYPVQGANLRSFVDDSIYPTFASAHGRLSYQLNDYKIYSVFLEQQITRDFFIEAAFNRVVSARNAVNGFVGANDYLFVDVNRQLPGGLPNPNVGLLYTQSQSTLIVNPNESDARRVMASYEYDFGTRQSKWLKYLGRHRAAVFFEQLDQSSASSNNGLSNATPLATTGAAAALLNGANGIQGRYYYEPAKKAVGNTGNQFKYPVIFAGDPLPPRDPSGVTPAYISSQGPSLSSSTIKTRALATQSYFWGGRVSVTHGVRRDDQESWRGVPNDFLAQRDANGVFPDPTKYDVRTFLPDSLRARGGSTYTRGLVYHVLPWASLTYNTSNNFQVNDGTRNIYGDLLPNPQGKGADYGLGLAFLDRRLFFNVTYYTNSTEDKIDSIAQTAAGNFKQFDQIWQSVANYERNPKYDTSPYSTLNTVWADSASTTSKGWEFSAVANLTRQWRFTINGSKRAASTTTERGIFVSQYMAQYIPVIKARPDWLALTTTNSLSVAARVADLETTLINFAAIKNLPADAFAAEWTLNTVQTYEFAPGTRFSGFALGASVNARGRSINGFAEDSKQVLDPTKPYYSPSYETFGAWITYKRKLFKNRVDWRLQLNVRNVFDAYTIYPLRGVDKRDGQGTQVNAVYTLREPRTYQLTSTFKF